MREIRFGLHNGQLFAHYQYKNLQWYLNETYLGFGDLRVEDVERIHSELMDGETFIGWNEHHGTPSQQTDYPMVQITNQGITHRIEIVTGITVGKKNG